jgi:hypothetical protein
MLWRRKNIFKPVLGSQLIAGHPLTRNLKAYWMLNEGSGDAIYDLVTQNPNGNNGTLANPDSDTWVPGRIGNAIYLNGVDNYITVTNGVGNLLDGLGNFSLSIWIKPQAASDNILGANNTTVWFYMNNNLGIEFATYFKGTGDAYTASNAVTLDVWNYLVVTRDGTSCKVYVNGVLFDTLTWSGDTNGTAGGNLQFGRYSTGGNEFLGHMDVISMYDRTLTAGEVFELYYNPVIFIKAGLSPAMYGVTAVTAGLSIPVAMHYFRNRRVA